MALTKTQKTFAASALGAIAAGGLAYYFRKELGSVLFGRPIIEEDVKAKLPIAKPLLTITDFEGNYDIDGVSYDVEGTIISSDDTKHYRDYPV